MKKKTKKKEETKANKNKKAVGKESATSQQKSKKVERSTESPVVFSKWIRKQHQLLPQTLPCTENDSALEKNKLAQESSSLRRERTKTISSEPDSLICHEGLVEEAWIGDEKDESVPSSIDHIPSSPFECVEEEKIDPVMLIELNGLCRESSHAADLD